MAVYPNSSSAADGFLRTSRLLGQPRFNGAQDRPGAQRGILTGILSPTASFPDGYGARVPLLPIKEGSMAAAAPITFAADANLLSGGPMEGDAAFSMATDGGLSLVVSMSGDGSVTIAGDGGLSLTIGLSGDGTMTLTGSGGLSLIIPVEGAASFGITGAADLKSRLALVAGVPDTTLTAEQVAQAVWSALAAVNDLPGSMGELLATAGSGGLSPTQVTMLTELWRIRGLDPANPVTVTTAQESAGSIVLDISGDGINTSTLTRQP